VHVGSYGRRNHSCTISAQSVQGLGSYGNPKFPIIIIIIIKKVKIIVTLSIKNTAGALYTYT